MLTQASLLRQGDWFTSVELKDTYFHFSVYPEQEAVMHMQMLVQHLFDLGFVIS